MEFLDKELDEYIENHTQQESNILQELNRETYLNVLMPRMLSGHLQGRVLAMFSKMIQPQHILEIGTYTGYSALCLAEGLIENGHLHTIDIDEERDEMVRQYISKSDYKDKITTHIGPALEIIPNLKQQWDIVFIDADKINYANYYNLVLNNVRKGGFIIIDNVLWSGKVLEKNRTKIDKDTEAIMQFNDIVHQDDRVENVLFPIRDGLMVVRKL